MDVPDPFFLDDDTDDDAPLSRANSPAISQVHVSAASPSLVPPKAPTPNIVPTPKQYNIRGLRSPSLFLPIPSADPLNPLLGKLVPSEFRPNRDVIGEWTGRDDHELIMSNSWRALARKTEEKIRSSRDEEYLKILNLWHLRLTSLARMRLYNQATVECSNLWAALEAHEDHTRIYIFDAVIPFDLLVFRARTSYFVKDSYDYLDQLMALRKKCTSKAKSSTDENHREDWKEKGVRIGLLIATQLIEMQDFKGAQKILDGLSASIKEPSAPLLSALGRLLLESGNIPTAATYFQQSSVCSDATTRSRNIDQALLGIARGEWAKAGRCLEKVLEESPEDVVALNAMSVVLLSMGKLDDSINTLETILKISPSAVVVAEPLVFNLATLYELRSATSAVKKRDLLIETAKWSGDGFRAAALKLS